MRGVEMQDPFFFVILISLSPFHLEVQILFFSRARLITRRRESLSQRESMRRQIIVQ